MKRINNSLKITAILCVFFFLLSCNTLEDESQSSSMLLVLGITGISLDGDEVSFHHSDVLIEGGVRADLATATLQAKLLNPEPLVPQVSQYTSIVVTRYVVTYSRSDGQNTPGVDIPYSFEGSMSFLIEIDATADISFVIVREAAKMEPPLYDLRGGGDEVVIQVTATIDFYGHDLVNNAVEATGYLTIFFADYGNE